MQIPVNLKDNSYSVFVSNLPNLEFNTKIAIISNDKIAKLHLEYLKSKIKADEIVIYTIPDGEQYKNLNTIEQILNHLFTHKLDRKSILVSFGGGVISDMVGFCASIYQRGIEFINIPTTLLAMVDASVGGKTGVNNKFGKNLIGSFYQPKAVYCDKYFLSTLEQREMSAGIAEAIKMAIMFDKDFFEYFQTSKEPNYDEIIAKCVQIKADIVSQDEKESGIRAVLNYGHTFAHVIEMQTNYSKYLHGEAVAIGMDMANDLAVKIGALSQDEKDLIKQILIKFNLPVKYKIPDIYAFYEAFFLDKKSQNNKIKFILPNGIGNHQICSNIPKEVVLQTLRSYQ